MDYWETLQAGANRLKRRILLDAMLTKLIGPTAEIHTFNTGKRGQYLVVWQPLARPPWYISFN